MASIYSKRRILYLSWYEKLLTGERIRKTESLRLRDTKENRRLAKMIMKKKESMLLFSHNKMQREIDVSEANSLFMETKKEKAANTIQYYKNSLRLLVQNYGNVNVSEISSEQIKEIVKRFEYLSKDSIISYKRGMKIFFNYLIKEKYMTENPIGKIEKNHDRKVEVMTDKELREILYHLKNKNKDDYDLVKFLVLSGFRISEALSLEWSDIKEDHIIVKNQKGKRKDYFPLTEEISKHLGMIKRKEKKVFENRQVSSARSTGRQLTKITEGKYSFHSFRKKFGTDWAGELMPAELKEIMRHKDISTTMEYYVGMNVIQIGEKMAVAKRKLNEIESDQKCQIIEM